MFTCTNCGEKFNIEDGGHIDDHMELCPKCAAWFQTLGKEDSTDV